VVSAGLRVHETVAQPHKRFDDPPR